MWQRQNIDALPLYRQEQQLKRINIDLPRSTLANWIIKAGLLVQPLINVMRDTMLAYDILAMDETTLQVLNELGKAMNYADKQWTKLATYTLDGRLRIDNNLTDNAIRPFVIGRKNFLFCASVAAAKASANLYSLIETAKANKIEPYRYLCKVFTELPRASSLEDIEELLPFKQKPRYDE